ncbi:mucin-4-like isoform X2 [Dreissena polymorpha]|uniref:Uncharacterized protein n=1 Tax=Dreissena polymorpha TaxID=45954 RepID=A0A9D4CKT7_DREPO|nr:mucin-4-like isoform X2 [Dreissena polymorpha]KAH3726464.1 hypothetical protein DPMN_052331 [Dreissena polymorpha]
MLLIPILMFLRPCLISAQDIRLVNGTTPSQGRLEVFYDNTWGTVCDDYFDDKDAIVVCRMLRFSENLSKVAVRTEAAYGQGTDPIWLDDVHCDGYETSLFNCPASWRNHNCNHGEDVGVDCDLNQSVSITGNQPVIENSSLSLRCQLSACYSYQCTYSWTSSKAISGNTSQQSLTFENITRDWNTATIYCHVNVTSPSTVIVGSTTMDVQYGPSSATVSVSSPLTVTENTSFPTAITCSSPACNPLCNANWFNGSTKILNTTLFSTPISRYFAGSYICNVSNAVGIWTTQLDVIVNYGPSSATVSVSSPLTVTENTSPPTAITCSSPACSPLCNANWFNGSTKILNTTLFSTPISRYFAGSYICNVSNAVGFWTTQLDVIVNYGPSSAPVSVSSPLTVTENTSPPTAITCSSPACNPLCNANWFNGSTKVLNTTLFSTPISRYFAGSYICNVSNAVGFRITQLDVIVNCRRTEGQVFV